jgi:hypothetical protein
MKSGARIGCQRANQDVPFPADGTDHFQRQRPNAVQVLRSPVRPDQGRQFGRRLLHARRGHFATRFGLAAGVPTILPLVQFGQVRQAVYR